MSQDFISGLHADLVEAMERYERRSPRGRLAAGRSPQRLRPASLARVAAGDRILQELIGHGDGPQVAVAVRMHPADRACLDPEVLAGRSVAFADDPTLSRGDAVVETTDNVVDATLGSALARVREVLGR